MRPSAKRMIAVFTNAFVYFFLFALLDALLGNTTPITFSDALLIGFVAAWCFEADQPRA